MNNDDVSRSVFSPTLLIGLGGTGSEILLDVRERILGNNQGILNKFLFIDTDIKTAAKKKGYTEINNSEICMVGVRSARNFLKNYKHYKGLSQRFPEEDLTPQYVGLLSMGSGAAQIRSLGALAFALDYGNIRKKIEATIDELTKAQNRQEARANQRGITIKKQSIIVYVVGSLVGGTGSGSFIDTAVVARDVIAYNIGWDTTVIGVFTLPDGYDPVVRNDKVQRENIRANAYASLKELQYLSDREFDRILFDYDDNMKVELSDRSDPVFNNIYLVDNRNSTGSITLDDMYQLIGSSIYQDVGTSFGANSQSAQINMGVFNGLSPDTKSGKQRVFSSLAASSLVYPAERVASYCTMCSMNELLGDRVLGAPETVGKINNEVDSFLQRNSLEERNTNQVIDSLLKSDSGVLSSNTYGMDPMQWAENIDIQSFIDELESERNRVDSIVKQEVVKLVDENRTILMHGSRGTKTDRLHELVSDWALNLAVTYNFNTTVKALNALVSTSKAIAEELKKEQSDWERKLTGFNDDLEQYKDDLLKMGWIDRKMGGKHKPIVSRAILRYNELVDAKMEQWAKSRAVDIIVHLGLVCKELLAKWNDLVATMECVQKEAQDSALLFETTRAKNTTSRFATEIEITDPGYEKEYYSENWIEPAKVFSGVVALHAQKNNPESKSQERDFINWLLESCSGINGSKAISDHLSTLIREKYWQQLLETNIMDFIKDHKKNASEFLSDKLEQVFDLCSPFWHLGSQKLATLDMPETFCVSVKFISSEEGDVPPKEIQDWIYKYEESGAKGQTLDSDTPYKIAVNKRVHGARAYFLSSTPRWEKIYKSRLRQSEDKYMMHVHSALNSIPELAPSDNASLLSFAKGMALGFIVKRGDWYYYGLEEKYDMKLGMDFLQAGYTSHWDSVHTISDVPEKCGYLWFKLEKATPEDDLKLGQGREIAIKELQRRDEWVKQIDEAFSEYYKHVGAELRIQLADYMEKTLKPASRKATGSNKEILEKEIAALTEWAKNNT